MNNNINKASKKIITVIKFCCFLFLLYCVFCRVTWIFRGNGGEGREDIYGFRNQGEVDVVLYGGSNLLRYYQPLEAWNQKGYTSYNYATSSAMADLFRVYIEESRTINEAQLYVCDIRSVPMINTNVYDASLRNWSDSLPVLSYHRWKGIYTYLSSRNVDGEDVLSYYFDIIKYHTNMYALKDNIQWKFSRLNTIYNVDKGFEPNQNSVPFDRPRRIYDVGVLTNQQDKAVSELLDYCDENDLNILFICCPFVPSENDWLTINAVGKKILDRGYQFVNFNDYYEEIGLDFETDFGDVNHVNYLGAEKYTNYLIEYIGENYKIPDHRGEEKYRCWNEDYANYLDKQSEWRNSIQKTVDSHKEAKTIGDGLPTITDFYEWYSEIKNNNFSTIIIVKTKARVDRKNPVHILLRDCNIDKNLDSYIGVWNGNDVVDEKYNESSMDFILGVDGGRGTVPCHVDLSCNQIKIGEAELPANDSGIQVLVYDNNYLKIVDNVVLSIEDENSVVMARP